jgi:hypothetical protein
MKKIQVVSVSLGSSSRDKSAETGFAGFEVRLRRIGCDGDRARMIQLLREVDHDTGVDAVALGGIDLLWEIEGKKYIVREARNLADLVKNKPVVCGFGLKTTLEVKIARELFEEGHLMAEHRVLFMSLAERYAMGRLFWDQGCPMIFGDLLFTMGIPLPIRSLRTGRALARTLLPLARQMPIRFFYPQGEKQDVRAPKHEKCFSWADVLAGDFLLIRKFAPDDLTGKVVITNTTTDEDRAMLAKAGVHKLIATTPRIQGRTFGANVLEGLVAAVLVKEGKDPVPENYPDVLERYPLNPAIEILNSQGNG